jgi:predicted dienelactone hydrolase
LQIAIALCNTIFQRSANPKTVKLAHKILCTLALMLGSCWAMPVSAAERLLLRLGPFEQSIEIEDLERFAKTGELPGNLRAFSVVLNQDVRNILLQRLQIDPNITDRVIKDWLRSPAAEQLIKSLGDALPNSSIEQVQAAISIATRQANGLSAISLLRAFPGESVTVDVTSAIALALKFNPSFWESQVLGPMLERELATDTSGFDPQFNPAQIGFGRVQEQTLTFWDQQRDRLIPADIYWNDANSNSNGYDLTAPDPGPLVIISHGFGADRGFLRYLARHLASHGLTVAALEHPGSNVNWLSRASVSANPGDLISPSEFIDRPKDISFLLDELQLLNEQPGAWQGKFNTTVVSVIGHSLGGYTALALAGGELQLDELRQSCKSTDLLSKSPAEWLQCAAANLPERRLQLRDERVKNAIALNPVVGQLFGKTGLKQVTIPTLILSGTQDAFTPAVNHQLQPFTQLGGEKYLLTAIGGTHLSVGDPNNLGIQRTLVQERISDDVEPLHQLLQGVSLALIKQLTPEAQTYKPFLTPAYAQLLSSQELPLRFNTQLPASVYRWLQLTARR